jgi:hypothetical protein
MAADASLLPFSAPPTAAPDLSDYMQFIACSVPEESGAVRAYEGFIRPFSDDATARRVLRAFEDRLTLQISGGRLDVDLLEPRDHHLDHFLVDMAVPFKVLLLEFHGPERPRTYLLDPRMVPRVSACPHLRTDKSIEVGGQKFPALCVYSGALEKFDPSRSALEQHLDQTATYLAKYLVWLRTRQLYCLVDVERRLVRQTRVGEESAAAKVLGSPDLFLDGYWPGPSAPSGIVGHLSTIKPDDECWCWTGKRYGECCRAKELARVADIESKIVRNEFVGRLMAAVHARLRI